MPGKLFHSSLTRIADLDERWLTFEPLQREVWEEGDYVVGEVCEPPGALAMAELASGRVVKLVEGDRVIGAFGVRHATLEVVGSWRAIGADGRMQALTAAGLFGAATSVSAALPRLLNLRYGGHVLRDGRKQRMADFVGEIPDLPYTLPTVLVVGTTMSGGKTTAAKVLIRALKAEGLRVAGTKLTGAGRYRDILGMSDAGADAVFDFVDVGLPSTVCPHRQYRRALRQLLSLLVGVGPDVVVAEAGASPLEPYNGDTLMREIRREVVFTVLCASDPYAVVGVMKAFRVRPDLVAGLATSTSAGVELVERLTDVPAVNVLDAANAPRLAEMLRRALGR